MKPDPEERFAIPFVKAVVLDPPGRRFLLQKRVKEGDPYEGFWELPGGKMRLGETAESALRRELLEETGLTLRQLLGQRGPELTDSFGRSARILTPLITVEIVSGPWPLLGNYFACLTDGDPLKTAEGDEHRLITPEAFYREFLAETAAGRCTTLDLLALRNLIEEDRLGAFFPGLI